MYQTSRQNYVFRRGPVPGTGISHYRYSRKIGHWFRAYKQDRIPEHAGYVRNKGRLPDAWDMETAPPRSKSWKSQCRKHQWR